MSSLNERKVMWAFALSLLVLAVNAFVSYRDLIEQISNTSKVVLAREVLDGIDDISTALKDAESARRGFLIDGNSEDHKVFQQATGRALLELDRVKLLTKARSERYVQILSLEKTIKKLLKDLTQSVDKIHLMGVPLSQAMFEFESIRRQFNLSRSELQSIQDDEARSLALRVEERRTMHSRNFVTISVASTLALLTIAGTYVLVRRYLGERRRTEATLRESEARIRLLFDSVGEGIYGIDNAGRCTFCNPAALRLLGFGSLDEVLGKDMHQLIHHTLPDGSPFPAHQCPIYQTFHSGIGVVGIEDYFYRADGRKIPVEYRAHAIRRAGEVLGAVVTFVDIAPRRRTATEMRQRDRALQAIGQGVFISDLDAPGNPIIYANIAFERLTGYLPADWKGKSLAQLQSDEYLGSSGEFTIASWDQAELSTELRARRKDGSSYWQAITLAPVSDPQAQSNHLVGVITDISERRESEQKLRASEERLRLTIESVHDYAIFSINIQGRISSWNSGAERLFGFSESSMLGQTTDCLYLQEDQVAQVPAMELSQAQATGRFAEDRWHMKSDGRTFLASGLTTAVRDLSGGLLGYTKVARDITEAKRTEMDLRAAKEAAESAVRAKSTFLANMGHELRTPLNAIIGYSEMLGEEALDRGIPDFVPDLERIRESGYLLLKLINNILDLSKIETGRMSLADEPIDLADLVRAVVRTVEPLAEKQGNTIQVIYSNDLGTLDSDFTKLSQGLNHLLSNAIKFTEAGTIHFTVSRERDQADQEWVSFIVADDGIGMTRDQISGLFQPFIQADGSATRRYGGTGLGLTITHRFCQMLGGRIDVVSSPGQGTTFIMKLPTRRIVV